MSRETWLPDEEDAEMTRETEGLEGVVRFVTEQLSAAGGGDEAKHRITAAQVVSEVSAEVAAEAAAEAASEAASEVAAEMAMPK